MLNNELKSYALLSPWSFKAPAICSPNNCYFCFLNTEREFIN